MSKPNKQGSRGNGKNSPSTPIRKIGEKLSDFSEPQKQLFLNYFEEEFGKKDQNPKRSQSEASGNKDQSSGWTGGFSMKSNIMNFFSKVNKDTKMKKRLHKHRTRYSQLNFSELKKVKRRGITIRDFSSGFNGLDLESEGKGRTEKKAMPSIQQVGGIDKEDSRTAFQRMLSEIDIKGVSEVDEEAEGEEDDEEEEGEETEAQKSKIKRSESFFKPKNLVVSKEEMKKMNRFLYNEDPASLSTSLRDSTVIQTPAPSNRRATGIFSTFFGDQTSSPSEKRESHRQSRKGQKFRKTIVSLFRVFGEKSFWQKSRREIRNDLKKYRSKLEETIEKLEKKIEVHSKKKEKTLLEMHDGIVMYRNNSLLSLLKYFRKLFINKLLRYSLMIEIEEIYKTKILNRIELINNAIGILKKKNKNKSTPLDPAGHLSDLPFYVREAFFSPPDLLLKGDPRVQELDRQIRLLEKLIPQMERIYHIERRIRAKSMTKKEMRSSLNDLIDHAKYIYQDEAIDRFEDFIWQDEIQDQFNKIVRDIRTPEGEQVEAFLQTVTEIGLEKIPPNEITDFIKSFVNLLKKSHKFTKKREIRLLKQFSDKLFFSLIGYDLVQIEYGLAIPEGAIVEFLRKQQLLRKVDPEIIGVNTKFLDLEDNYHLILPDSSTTTQENKNITQTKEEFEESELYKKLLSEDYRLEEVLIENNNDTSSTSTETTETTTTTTYKRMIRLKEREKPFLKALSILNNMEYCVVPNDMVWSIYCAAKSSTRESNEQCKKNKRSFSFGADELMPIIIYLIIHSNTPYLSAHLSYLSKFSTERSSESVYYLTCFEGAVMYIQNMKDEEISKLYVQIDEKRRSKKKKIEAILRKRKRMVKKIFRDQKKEKKSKFRSQRMSKKASALKKLGKLISPPKGYQKNKK